MPDTTAPSFWRDGALPFLEARFVGDGRQVCYDRHFHDTFSIGRITGGRSRYLNGSRRETVATGDVVVMNPGDVHACNPIAGEGWSYSMLYVDRGWLAGLQQDLGFSANRDLQAFSTTVASRPDSASRTACESAPTTTTIPSVASARTVAARRTSGTPRSGATSFCALNRRAPPAASRRPTIIARSLQSPDADAIARCNVSSGSVTHRSRPAGASPSSAARSQT